MIYRVQTSCEQGEVRPNNEDAIRFGSVTELGCLWVAIADGMGGHKAGEVASAMLVEYAESQLSDLSEVPEEGWLEFLCGVLEEANLNIFTAAEENEDYAGMGTTGVIMVCAANCAYIAWVGDSRAYLFRKSSLKQLTQDHTMIQYLLDKGSISEEEAARSNTKHLLSRAIGAKDEIEVDAVSCSLENKDVLMLSTDGVHDHIADAVIAGYLAQSENGNKVTDLMVKQAIDGGSRDNLTLAIINLE